MIRMIFAINNQCFIGKNNTLMYRLKDDMLNFKKMTQNNIVVMGRKTFESLNNRGLPNRLNVVVTSKAETFEDIQTITTHDMKRSETFTKEGHVVYITPDSFINQFLPFHRDSEDQNLTNCQALNSKFCSSINFLARLILLLEIGQE